MQKIDGRYCSIRGRIAAQLKVVHNISGKIVKLYVTTITERLSEMTNQNAIEGAVHTKLWKTNTLLYGLATDTSQNIP